jgi:hypothetical protein
MYPGEGPMFQGQRVSQAGNQHKQAASRAPKRWTLSELHGVIIQIILFIVTAMGTSNSIKHSHY